jgi:hypothetical protein
MAAYTPEQIETLRENLKQALDRKSKLRGIWTPDWSLHDELGMEKPELLTLTQLTKLLENNHSSQRVNNQPKTAAKRAYVLQSYINAEARKSMIETPSLKKTFLSIGGTTATGKSSIRKKRMDIGPSLDGIDDELERTLLELIPYDGVIVDPDDAKLVIPEFQSHLKHRIPGGASFVHEESRELAEELRITAMARNLNLIYDTSGQFNLGYGIFRDLTEDDYEANAIYYLSDIDAAIERAIKRAEESGRSVPVQIIRNIQDNLIRDMASHVRNFNRVILIDSTDIENPQMMLDVIPGEIDGSGASITNFVDEAMLLKYWTGVKWWKSYES